MNLTVFKIQEGLRALKVTVLHRQGGRWYSAEISLLCHGLMTEVSSHPSFPGYLVLFGHHTKEETLAAIMGGQAYTATPLIGVEDRRLPFRPGFI